MDIFSIVNSLNADVWEKKSNVPDDLNKLGNSVSILSLNVWALKLDTWPASVCLNTVSSSSPCNFYPEVLENN